MRIGIDIDGVMCKIYKDGAIAIAKYLNVKIDTSERKDEIHSWRDYFDMSDVRLYEIWKIVGKKVIANAKPLSDCVKTINNLWALHGIYVISYRPKEFTEVTKTWLEENKIRYDVLHLIGRDKGIKKWEDSYAKKCDIFIDDETKVINGMNKEGIKGILFTNWKDAERQVEEIIKKEKHV